jgi:hypothetical protein
MFQVKQQIGEGTIGTVLPGIVIDYGDQVRRRGRGINQVEDVKCLPVINVGGIKERGEVYTCQ